MLGKLIKHEFNSTYKLMLAVFGTFALLTLFGCISVRTMVITDSSNIFMILALVFYGLSFFALMISTFIFMCSRFNKTMYSAQGYLTHTLPVKTSTVFNTKLLVSVIWMILTALVLTASLYCLIASGCGSFKLSDDFWLGLSEADEEFFKSIHMHFATFCFYIIITIILGIVESLLWIFTSMTIGQLSNKNRTVLTVVSAIGLYILNEVASVSFLKLFDFNEIVFSNNFINVGDFTNKIFIVSIIYLVITCVIEYTVCLVINKKKLNLQ